ncbi:ADP-forming succinate--CoA ligase subunit beta [Rickettsiales endosymbiont of Stachyamoeba lipophora]|uniref:ADP-forming succinate--CoA ligase subunit beta n=1 Tax=Rickettsiales endosymbiont of Stachyamoeba lipophora TaxID=2486578 RepID=UPI000F64DDCA|nr:ADP-forming succinate--CoA ligase subunit beta [Rickettsiales endosymbiont of Stachyamoeba lipophora]AZL15610.1 ADP-forming succinate--CoA ligase subunit beta [Rickettsiales endosymbiont of Stachyamoeba lipophora]
MNIHEYQAKQILRKYDVPASKGVVLVNINEFDSKIGELNTNLYVVKAQIHAGGRGKAGGVKLAKTKEEAKEFASKMFGMTLVTHQTGPEGQVVRKVYIEEGSDIAHEFYLSLVLDRATSSVVVMASREGGVDIEEVAENSPEKIIKFAIDPATHLQDFHTRKLGFGLELDSNQQKQMAKFLSNLYKAFIATDASQIEINPLILNTKGDLLALDAKFNLDDNGLFKHAAIAEMRDLDEEDPLEQRAGNFGLSYIKMDGDIGCMVNGAGLAMATMDIIKLNGGEPANFLDVGGGANKEKVCEAFKIILSDSKVKGILVNIFGGIMRCNIIAEGIIAAAKEVGISVPLVVRLEGTNVDQGKQILASSGLNIIAADNLGDAAQKIVKAVYNK